MSTELYYAIVQSTPSSQKRWQRDLAPMVAAVEGNLFTRQGIEDFKAALEAKLAEVPERFKTEAHISGPDWEYHEKHGFAPGIYVGYGLYVTFHPVTGYYNNNA